MFYKIMKPEWVTPEIVKAAQEHAMRDFPHEACGLVSRSRGYVPCKNYARETIEHFEISPSDWLAVPDCVGVLHSHTNGNYAPSANDMQGQIDTGVAWGIVVATEDSASEPLWWGADTPVAPLEGRQFIHGIHDCYSLIRDWYRTERGILLKEYPRDNVWWEQGESLYDTFFRDAGFEEIPNDATGIQEGDVFICKVRSPVDNHGGLYVGNQLILHHVGGHQSMKTPASPWMRIVSRWVRYGG